MRKLGKDWMLSRGEERELEVLFGLQLFRERSAYAGATEIRRNELTFSSKSIHSLNALLPNRWGLVCRGISSTQRSAFCKKSTRVLVACSAEKDERRVLVPPPIPPVAKYSPGSHDKDPRPSCHLLRY